MQPAMVMPFAVLMLGLSSASGATVAAAGDEPRPTAEAPAGYEVSAEPTTPNAQIPTLSHHRSGRRLTVAQSIDESVRRLAHGLDLDLGQQVRLRQILVDQHRQMMQLRTRGAGEPGDVTSAMLAIYDQARARIRSMLNEDQLKKYPAAVPREQTAPAQADLQHWMELQESKRRQDGVSP